MFPGWGSPWTKPCTNIISPNTSINALATCKEHSGKKIHTHQIAGQWTKFYIMCNEKIAECEGVREIYDPSRRTIFFWENSYKNHYSAFFQKCNLNFIILLQCHFLLQDMDQRTKIHITFYIEQWPCSG
jgi:hypothetical protein